MLTWDYIEKNTLWVIKYGPGDRDCGTWDEVESRYKLRGEPAIDDEDILAPSSQPKELQEFYTDYEFARFHMGMRFENTKDFYMQWSKNPLKFKPDTKPVIMQLSKALESLDENDGVIIMNYNGDGAGNHYVGSFVEALRDLDLDFDVVYIGTRYNTNYIEVQTNDSESFRQFDIESNRNSIRHDPYLGDGRYGKRD